MKEMRATGCQKRQMKDEDWKSREKSRNPCVCLLCHFIFMTPISFFRWLMWNYLFVHWGHSESSLSSISFHHSCRLNGALLGERCNQLSLNPCVLSDELEYCHVMTGLLRSTVSLLFSGVDQKHFPAIHRTAHDIHTCEEGQVFFNAI